MFLRQYTAKGRVSSSRWSRKLQTGEKPMKLWHIIIATIGFLLTTASSSVDISPPHHTNKWTTIEMGIIGMASQEILTDALAFAQSQHHDGLIIILDTPGGVLENTRKMVQSIMDSRIPVVVWVGPSGAHAGSAGAFITIAAHIAAMAPGTNIGAAHPVKSGGQDIEEGDMKAKVENDTVAFMEAIAETRQRNKEMAASFVVNSISLTAYEAQEHNIIDLISPNVPKLLTAIHNKELKLANGSVIVLDTAEAKALPYEKTIRQRFLEILSNPNLFYLLFIGGLIGLGFELTHPGSIVPGVLGGIAMLLALIATSVLPVNFGAMLLVIAGVGFIVAEAFVPSFGILGIGGVTAFVLGSFLLVDPSNEQGLRVAWTSVMPAALVLIGFGLTVFFLVVKSERRQLATGGEALIGQKATVYRDFAAQHGKVMVDGEIWNASCSQELDSLCKGDEVAILALNGLELIVKKSN